MIFLGDIIIGLVDLSDYFFIINVPKKFSCKFWQKKPFCKTTSQNHLKTLTKLDNNDDENYFKMVIL